MHIDLEDEKCKANFNPFIEIDSVTHANYHHMSEIGEPSPIKIWNLGYQISTFINTHLSCIVNIVDEVR